MLCLSLVVILYSVVVCGVSPPSSVADDLVSGLGDMWGQAQKMADQALMQTYATTATGAGALMQYGGAARRVLANIPLTATPEQQMDAVVSALTGELTAFIPQTVPIEDMEMEAGASFLCGTRGLMYDMKTMEKVDTRLEEGPSGTSNLYIKYSFKDLHFFFDNFAHHVLHVKPLRGQLDLHLLENEVELKVNIPTVSDLVANVAASECVVQVMDLRASKLGSATAKITSTSKVRRYFVESKLNEALQNDPVHLEHLKNMIEVKVLLQFHKALTSTGNWVCKDKNLIYLIKDKGGSLNAPVYSENFYTYCSDKKQ